MNETTELNSELLSADARGRKHIPVAVFAVILVHVVLFLVLLIAAGCRSSARAKKNGVPVAELAQAHPAATVHQQQVNVPPVAESPAEPVPTQMSAAIAAETVTATEPVAELESIVVRSKSPEREVTQRGTQEKLPAKKAESRPTAKVTPGKTASKQQFYVVKSGDTLEKIAKRHGTSIQAVRTANKMKNDVIFPGQKLQLHSVNAAQVQSKPKRSNEV